MVRSDEIGGRQVVQVVHRSDDLTLPGETIIIQMTKKYNILLGGNNYEGKKD